MIQILKEIKLDSNGSFVLTDVHVVFLKALSKKIKPFDPAVNDVLYFPSGCNIPSAKLKNYIISHSIRRTNDIQKANSIVLNKEILYDKLNHDHFYIIDKQELLDQLEQINHTKVAKDLIDKLYLISEQKILMKYSAYRSYDNTFNVQVSTNEYKVLKSINVSDIPYFEKLFSLKMISEYSILKDINGVNSVEITGALYDQLSNMLISPDEDNHTMAMEIMANCNYMKSLPYLFLLFEQHSIVLENNATKRHVNFKSLLAMLDITSSRAYYININHMVKVLLKYNKATKETLDFLMSHLESDYYVMLQRGNHYINNLFISEISLKNEELTKALGFEYKYKLQNGSREN